jgi:DNA modification methylase
MSVNRLILGDNLEILKSIESDSVDLIYLDPPFFSNRNYEVIWGDTGEIRSFQDRWSGGISHYIDWLKERVEEMHRVLKPTGSIFLHCDWHANAYIRVHILDRIFGEENFRGEIVWQRHNSHNDAKKKLAVLTDTIWYYSKSKKIKYNPIYGALTEKYTDDFYKYDDGDGRGLYRLGDMASNEGDIVLDPFLGGGTTIAVADRLNRQWIGVDQSPRAVKVTEFRLQKQTDLFTAPYTIQLYKYDYDTLRYKDAFEFESWIIQQFGGVPQNRKGGDKGIDGKMGDGVPIQVKRSDNVPRDVIDKFPTASQRYDKSLFQKNQKARLPIGYIIAFSFNKGAVEEVARLKTEDNIIIKLIKVDEIVPIAVKPVIGVHINELEQDDSGLRSAGSRKIEFVALGQSPAGIEFYSWDFTYNKDKGFKPSVIIDKEGKQILTLKAGEYNIAVKVVDNDGLENTEVTKIIIN